MGKTFEKSGRVAAFDSAFTGEELTWENIDSLSDKEFADKRSKAMNFYNYYLDTKTLKQQTLVWMKENGYSRKDISHVKRVPDHVPSTTCGKLCRAMMMGMPTQFGDLQHNDDVWVRQQIAYALSYSATKIQTTTNKNSAPTLTPQQRLENKINKLIISTLDAMIDDQFVDEEKTKIAVPNLYRDLKYNKIPNNGLKFVDAWIEKVKEEYLHALNGSDEYAKESFSYLSKPALKNRIKALENLETQVDKYRSEIGKTKKTRKKKAQDPVKVVKNLKYEVENKDFNIKSISPVKILDARKVYLFNSKYRKLTYLESDALLEVKGSTIKNFNVEKSYTMTLRKPEEALDILTTKTEKQIEKYINGLTTKKVDAKGRVNDKTIILRKF
jgi:hypothetical protein